MKREATKYAQQLRAVAPNIKAFKIRKPNALERSMVRHYLSGHDKVAFKKKFDMVEWATAPLGLTC